MALMILALAMLVTWHFLRCFGNPEQGWYVWPAIWGVLRDPRQLAQVPQSAIAIASILNFSLLILVSPFLMQVWSKSRLAWWFATISSGVAGLGFWVIWLSDANAQAPQLGGWCVLVAPLLNCFGLILARGERQPNQGSAAV